MPGAAGSCKSDSECTAGVNGRCTAGQIYDCTYDACFSDDDCALHTPCSCRPSAASNNGNFCWTGSQCAIDSDCGPGGYCSPSPPPTFCPGSSSTAYFCHTPNDTCLDDSDCDEPDAAPIFTPLCLYDAKAGHWECVRNMGCGAP